MLKIFNKILAKSNSYNYYLSNYDLYKTKLAVSEAERKVIENNLAVSEAKRKVIENNLTTYQKKLNLIVNSLEEVQKSQNNILKAHKKLENEIYTNRIIENVVSLKQNSKNGKNINIIFIMNFRNAVMDKLISLLQKDTSFHPTVLIIPYDLHATNIFDNGLNEHQSQEYEDNYEYYKKKGFNVIKGYDNDKKTTIDIELELKPDIIFYHTPWETTLPVELKIENLPSNVLFCYIPYGIHSSFIVYGQFNRELQNKAWKIFYQTKIHKKLAIKYSDKGASNVVLTGSPKMDRLIDGSHEEDPYPWIDSSHQKKRVIWAPHHSIETGICFSTFNKNYKFFYDFAKKYSEIEWVFKPHPNLRHYYLISDDEKFSNDNLEKYYKNWSNLPNATIYERGDYQNMFATSDGMITDSVSFLSEYLYSGKPGLFLTSPTQKFNEYGKIIKNAWYQIDGNNFKQIEKFIDKTIINKEDPLKTTRENLFNKYLKTNGTTASEKIYKYIKDSLT